MLNEKTIGERRGLNEYVEEREDDVECKKWVLKVLRVLNHCRWSKEKIELSRHPHKQTTAIVDTRA
jgi:hypothetical protein